MEKEIRRDYYLEQLINRKDNGLIKIVRCGELQSVRNDVVAGEFLDESLDSSAGNGPL